MSTVGLRGSLAAALRVRQPALLAAGGLARALQVPGLKCLPRAGVVLQRPQQLFCWDSS